MILVDSSAWIAHLRKDTGPTATTVRNVIARYPDAVLVGDLILLEVLRGAGTHSHAARLEAWFEQFTIAPLLDREVAIMAAQHYRTLRAIGVTVSKTTDLIIGTFCLQHGHQLLHDDRDFRPMEQHLGLQAL